MSLVKTGIQLERHLAQVITSADLVADLQGNQTINAASDTSRNGYPVERHNVKTCLAHPRTRQLGGAFLARSAK